MVLLSQAFAALAAAVLLAWRARVRGPWSGTRSLTVAAVIGILTFVSLSAAWRSWQGFRHERKADAAIPEYETELSGGAGAGANVPFVEWLRSQLPEGSSYQVVTNGADAATYQWLTYRLYPRVASPGPAHWVVFLGSPPPRNRSGFARVARYAPGLLLAERRQ